MEEPAVSRDSSDGALVGSVEVPVNGQWEEFSEKALPLKAQDGKHDLYFVFKNPKAGGGLMNIDSIEFRQ